MMADADVADKCCHDRQMLTWQKSWLSKNKKIQIAEIRDLSSKINELIKKKEFPIARYVMGAVLVAGFFIEKFIFMKNL